MTQAERNALRIQQGFVHCANADCPLNAWTLPHIKETWPHGLCPECLDPAEMRITRAVLRRPSQADDPRHGSSPSRRKG